MYRIIAAAAATLVCLCPTSVLADSNELPGYGAAVNPRVAVIQVGKDNDYGHPRPAVLDRLAANVGDAEQHTTVG